MQPGRTILRDFMIEQLGNASSRKDMLTLFDSLAVSIKEISDMVNQGALGGYLGALETENVQGEVQKKLDVLSNESILQHGEKSGVLSGMASEEMDDPYTLPESCEHGRYLLIFDPLDGSSNSDVNVSIGTIFSVFEKKDNKPAKLDDYLRSGREQVAAGYALYGPTTMLVFTIGKGVHGFTLDQSNGELVLTHPNMTVNSGTSEFAINASNERFWEPPVLRYIAECKAGKTGVRERDFNMRWIASMVAEVHRIFIRGGIFMYPKDSRDPSKPGRLRLMYEASPMAMLIEQAGGRASTGYLEILDVEPETLHQRVPVILGSKEEVDRVIRYHEEHDSGVDQPFESPLFGERSMFND